MNDKFWDIKKTKQDRIINGGLKIFAANGYRHASTDEIASEAEISKGLLFHYFYSKIGFYSFLCEYSGRFVLLEISAEFRRKNIGYFFDLHRNLLTVQSRVMRQYPYMLLFFDMAARESSKDAAEAAADIEKLVSDRYKQLFEQTELPGRLSISAAEKFSYVISLVEKDTAARLLADGSFTPERFIKIAGAYIEMAETFACKELKKTT